MLKEDTVKDVHPATPEIWSKMVWFLSIFHPKAHQNLDLYSMFWYVLELLGSVQRSVTLHSQQWATVTSLAYPSQAHLVRQVLASHCFMFFEERGLSCLVHRDGTTSDEPDVHLVLLCIAQAMNEQQILITPPRCLHHPNFLDFDLAGLTERISMDQYGSTCMLSAGTCGTRNVGIAIINHPFWWFITTHLWWLGDGLWHCYTHMYEQRWANKLFMSKSTDSFRAMELVQGDHPLQAPWNNLADATASQRTFLKTCHRPGHRS